MKKFVKNILIVLVALIGLNGTKVANAQVVVGGTPHVAEFIDYNFVNSTTGDLWIGPTSSVKGNKSGITTWTLIKPGATVSIRCKPDSVLSPVKMISYDVDGNEFILDTVKAKARLVFSIALENGEGKTDIKTRKDYMLMFSKKKTTVYIAESEMDGAGLIMNAAKERFVVFNHFQMEENTTACIIKNESSVALTFTDPNHPLYGLTLAASGGKLEITKTTLIKLVSTGFKDSKIAIIVNPGDDPLVTSRTLPIYENSEEVIITNDFFDLSKDIMNPTKTFPVKVKVLCPPTIPGITMEKIFKVNGKTETIKVVPTGSKGERGVIVYLAYGESYVNLKYSVAGSEQTTPLIIRASERTTIVLLYKDGEFIQMVQ